MLPCKWGGCNGIVPDEGGTCPSCHQVTPGRRTSKHKLKTWPEPFRAALSGRKKHELRKADRQFEVGDTLVLKEFIPCGHCKGTGLMMPTQDFKCSCCGALHGKYTGAAVKMIITYITEPGSFGLPDDLCILSIERLPDD